MPSSPAREPAQRRARARAHANVALAKYWGKSAEGANVPAMPSLSVTLEALSTTTVVQFEPSLAADVFELDGVQATGRPLARVTGMLDEVRAQAGTAWRARVQSSNSFPTGSGLASSASGFAALAMASMAAAGLSPDKADACELARRASASAARSIHGGFVRLDPVAGGARVTRIAPPDAWDLRVIVAVTTREPKSVGSTEGMRRTAETSPYYAAWLELSRTMADRVQDAIERRDAAALGRLAEHSALAMHACAMGAEPALVYWEPATLACVHGVRRMRAEGVDAWVTIDAGPQVKVLTLPQHAAQVAERLAAMAGVEKVIESRVGGEATVEVAP